MWDDAVDWLAQLAQVAGKTPFVADVGCGDGRMLAALGERGIAGWGCDASRDLVLLARDRGLDVDLADAADATIPQATLIIALGEVLSYRDTSGRSAFDGLLAEAASRLEPGGSIVFDVIGRDITPGGGWRAEDDWFVASRATVAADVLTREIATFKNEGEWWLREDETHRLTIFDPDHVEARLRELGLSHHALETIGPVALLPGRIAYLARKEVETVP